MVNEPKQRNLIIARSFVAVATVLLLASCGGVLQKAAPEKAEDEDKDKDNFASERVDVAKESVFAGIESLTMNDAGQFAISWSHPTSAPAFYKYLIYVQAMDEDRDTGEYITTYSFRPITKGILPYEDSPTKWGVRTAALNADQLAYTFEQSFDPDKAYGIQVKLEDEDHRLDYNEAVMTVKMDEVFAQDYVGCVSALPTSSSTVDLTYVFPAGAAQVDLMRREEVEEAEPETTEDVVTETQEEIQAEADKAAADAENVLEEGEIEESDPDEGFEVITSITGIEPTDSAVFTDTVAEGKKYKYRCRFHRLNFTKDGLNEPVAETPNVNPVPGAEGAITLTTLANTNIQLDWTAASDNVTPPVGLVYEIYASQSDNITTLEELKANSSLMGTVTGGTTFTAAEVVPFTRYHFNLLVRDLAGNEAVYVSKAKLSYPYPKIAFAAAEQTAAEADGAITLAIALEHAVDVPIILPFTTTYSVGEDSADFIFGTPIPLTIPAGSTTYNLTLTLDDDGLKESPDEQVKFTLGEPANDGQPGDILHTLLTITDDDSEVTAAIAETLAQTDPSRTLPVEFVVAFGREIDPATFTIDDIVQAGTATGITWNLTTSDNTTFVLGATAIEGDGTLIPTLAANRVTDVFGNPNLAAVASDNEVTYDSTSPTVQIVKAPTQDTPTNTLPVEFLVAFSEAIDPTTFTASDIAQAGDATVDTWTVTNSGDDTNFTVRATAVTTDPIELTTIAPALAADAVTDEAGNGNDAVSGPDTGVEFNDNDLTVTVSRQLGQAAIVAAAPAVFKVVFNKSIVPASFTADDISNRGTVSDGDLTWTITNTDGGDFKLFEITATGIASDGTVNPQIAVDLVEDAAGNLNLVSTDSGDNTVLMDATAPTVTIEQAATADVTQQDPTNDPLITFIITFSEAINPSTFSTVDIEQTTGAGFATGISWNLSTDDNITWILQTTSVANDGIVKPEVKDSVVEDQSGNLVPGSEDDADASPTDNAVVLDRVAPTVSVGADLAGNTATVLSNASASDDLTMTYLWEKTGGGANFSFDDATTLNPTFSATATDVYTLRLTVTDAAGNTASDSLDFDWDESAASVGIDAPAAGTYINGANESSFAVTGTCSEDDRDVVLTGDASATVSCSGGTWSANLDFSGAAEGTVTLLADHTDAQGNDATQASQDFSKDTESPDVTINQATGQTDDPTNGLPVEFTVVFDEPIDPDTFTAADITQKAVAGAAVAVTYAITNNTADTTFTVNATIVGTPGILSPELLAGVVDDVAGNGSHASTSTDGAVTYELTAPTVEAGSDILAAVPTQITDASAADDSGINSYLWEQTAGPGTVAFSSTTVVDPTLSADTVGTYTIRLTVEDNAGNSNTDTMTFEWDNDPPTVSISSPAANAYVNSSEEAAFTVQGSCSEDDEDVVITGDATATVNCNSGSWTANLDLQAAADGNVSITVDHADAASNDATSDSRTFVQDTQVDTGATNLITPADSSGGVDASYDDDAGIYMAWDAASDSNGIDSYVVTYYYTGDCSGGGNNTNSLTATFMSFLAEDGQILSFEVTTTDAAGNTDTSDCSSSIEIVEGTPSVSAVTVPTNNKVSVAGTVTDSDIDVTCSMDGQVRVLNNTDDTVILDWTSVTASVAQTLTITGGEIQSAVTNDGTYTLKILCRSLAQVQSSADTSRSITLDATAPTPFATFTGDTGATTDGDIDLSWTYTGGAITDYDTVTIRRAQEASAPGDCSSGSAVHNVPDPFSATTYTDPTGSTIGESFSYLVCFYDEVGNGTQGNQVQNIQARDTQDPNALDAFSGAAGSSHGELDVTIDYPADTSDYDRLEIRWLTGSTAPAAACTDGDGSSVVSTITNFATTTYTHDLAVDNGAAQSYRACIYDTSDNLTATSPTIVGASPLDSVAPDPLDGFADAGGGATGEIRLTIDFPDDVSDYNQVVVRRVAGATAPANCAAGDVVKTYNTSEFIDETLADTGLTAGGTYSYLACITDAAANTTGNQTLTGVTAGL